VNAEERVEDPMSKLLTTPRDESRSADALAGKYNKILVVCGVKNTRQIRGDL
jgi:hypothetical protein